MSLNKKPEYETTTTDGFMLLLFVIPILIMVDALLLAKLWAWFIVPTFNTQSISAIQAAGVMMVVDFLRKPGVGTPRKSVPWYETLVGNLVMSLVFFAFAAALHAGM